MIENTILKKNRQGLKTLTFALPLVGIHADDQLGS